MLWLGHFINQITVVLLPVSDALLSSPPIRLLQEKEFTISGFIQNLCLTRALACNKSFSSGMVTQNIPGAPGHITNIQVIHLFLCVRVALKMFCKHYKWHFLICCCLLSFQGFKTHPMYFGGKRKQLNLPSVFLHYVHWWIQASKHSIGIQTQNDKSSQTESGIDTLSILIHTIVHPQIRCGANSGLCDIVRRKFFMGNFEVNVFSHLVGKTHSY